MPDGSVEQNEALLGYAKSKQQSGTVGMFYELFNVIICGTYMSARQHRLDSQGACTFQSNAWRFLNFSIQASVMLLDQFAYRLCIPCHTGAVVDAA